MWSHFLRRTGSHFAGKCSGVRATIRGLLNGGCAGENVHQRVLRETDAAAAEARALSVALRELGKESDPLAVLIRNMRSAQRARN
jgi:hypothetical protein